MIKHKRIRIWGKIGVSLLVGGLVIFLTLSAIGVYSNYIFGVLGLITFAYLDPITEIFSSFCTCHGPILLVLIVLVRATRKLNLPLLKIISICMFTSSLYPLILSLQERSTQSYPILMISVLFITVAIIVFFTDIIVIWRRNQKVSTPSSMTIPSVENSENSNFSNKIPPESAKNSITPKLEDTEKNYLPLESQNIVDNLLPQRVSSHLDNRDYPNKYRKWLWVIPFFIVVVALVALILFTQKKSIIEGKFTINGYPASVQISLVNPANPDDPSYYSATTSISGDYKIEDIDKGYYLLAAGFYIQGEYRCRPINEMFEIKSNKSIGEYWYMIIYRNIDITTNKSYVENLEVICE